MPNTGRLGWRLSKPRILRQRDPFTYKTQQMATKESGLGLFGGAKEISKNVFYQGGRPTTSSKRGVRRLHVTDPYNLWTSDPTFGTQRTVATFSNEANMFTNNPNPMYDPSIPARGVREVSTWASKVAANVPGKAGRGHQKVIKRTLFNQTGGKRLKRR